MYYEFAPVAPAEALIEQFYSIAGFVWNNRRYTVQYGFSQCILCDNEALVMESSAEVC